MGRCSSSPWKQPPESYINSEPIGLLPLEYNHLSDKYGNKNFIIKGAEAFLPLPCPFLKNGQCIIYRERPLVCVLYPFQPGGTDGDGRSLIALSSSCPEARRITKQVYMMNWRLRKQFNLLGKGNFMKFMEERHEACEKRL
jgi:Fe-S-cluster containining protein